MFNPAPPPPPASDDKSTEFPFEILSAFVPSLNDNVCESVFVKPSTLVNLVVKMMKYQIFLYNCFLPLKDVILYH